MTELLLGAVSTAAVGRVNARGQLEQGGEQLLDLTLVQHVPPTTRRPTGTPILFNEADCPQPVEPAVHSGLAASSELSQQVILRRLFVQEKEQQGDCQSVESLGERSRLTIHVLCTFCIVPWTWGEIPPGGYSKASEPADAF